MLAIGANSTSKRGRKLGVMCGPENADTSHNTILTGRRKSVRNCSIYYGSQCRHVTCQKVQLRRCTRNETTSCQSLYAKVAMPNCCWKLVLNPILQGRDSMYALHTSILNALDKRPPGAKGGALSPPPYAITQCHGAPPLLPTSTISKR